MQQIAAQDSVHEVAMDPCEVQCALGSQSPTEPLHSRQVGDNGNSEDEAKFIGRLCSATQGHCGNLLATLACRI